MREKSTTLRRNRYLLLLAMMILAFTMGDKPAIAQEMPPAPCERDSSLDTTTAAITGNVTYLARIRLPQDAVIQIELVDLNNDIAITKQTIVTTGEQVPIPFNLAYNPSDINSSQRYGVTAQIRVQNELRWATTTDYEVITQGAPSSVDLVVNFVDETVPSGDVPTESLVAHPEEAPLPEEVATAVQEKHRSGLGDTEMLIESYSRQTWSDGCLGLGGPDEGCLSVLIEGWQVELVETETHQRYVYRTNIDGTIVRLDEASSDK